MSIENTSLYSDNPIPLIMDYTSALPIAFIFANVMDAVHTRRYVEMILLITTMCVADGLTFVIKRLSRNIPSGFEFLLHRPNGACNTDILSRNGPKPIDTPGFPSGHVTMATVFALYRLLRLYRNYDNVGKFIRENPIAIVFYLGIIVLMGYARWYKRCHNIFQIVGGFVFGAIFAILLDKIVRDFL